MKRYLLSSPKIDISIEVWYNWAGILCRMDMINTELDEAQLVYLFKSITTREKDFKAAIAATPFTVKEMSTDVSFEDFALIYPLARNTHLARAYWPTMKSKKLHLMAYFSAFDYREYCKRNASWYNPLLPEKFLKTKQYLNNWKNL